MGCGCPQAANVWLLQLGIGFPLEPHSWLWPLEILEIKPPKQPTPKADWPASWAPSPSDTLNLALQWREEPREDQPQERQGGKGRSTLLPKAQALGIDILPKAPNLIPLGLCRTEDGTSRQVARREKRRLNKLLCGRQKMWTFYLSHHKLHAQYQG